MMLRGVLCLAVLASGAGRVEQRPGEPPRGRGLRNGLGTAGAGATIDTPTLQKKTW